MYTTHRYITVFEHDGGGFDIKPCGPFVFEQYLDQATRENAQARASCLASKDCGWRRIAHLDFDLGGEANEPHVIVMSHDGTRNGPTRPLVWESYLQPARCTRAAMQRAVAVLERSHYRYGAGRLARVVYVTPPVSWAVALLTNPSTTGAKAP